VPVSLSGAPGMDVEFHSGLAEPLEHAALLLRKAQRAGARVCIASPGWEALSHWLWVRDARDFMAHARPGAAAPVWRRSPLWLVAGFTDVRRISHGAPCPGVWVNLGADAPGPLEGCERLIELVSMQPDDAQAARLRWRAYISRGLTPVVRFDGRAALPTPSGG
jgi:DNA polymerase-3 subunit chi